MSTQPIDPLETPVSPATAADDTSWDISGVKTNGNQFARPVQLQPACMNLRHKLMYCDERHARLGVVDATSDTRVFLCVRTGDSQGPDDQPVHPQDCCAARTCFKAPHGLISPATDPGQTV